MDSTGPASTWSATAEPAAVVARSSLISSAALLVALATWLLVRRIAGVFSPLAPEILLLSGLLLMAAISGWRHVWLHHYAPATSLLRLISLGSAMLLVLIAAVMSLPGTATWAVATLWLMIIIHEGWWCRRIWKWPANARLATAAPESAPDVADTLRQCVPPIDDEFTQRVVRYMDQGTDVVVADFRCQFHPRERVQTLHAVFCPPFAGPPEIVTEHLDGPAASLRIVQALSYGARLEVRRVGGGDEGADILVRLVARAAAAE